MKILITGTHFTTALAVIEEFKQYNDVKLIYVGRKTTREGDQSPSAESKIIPELGVKFISITTGRIQRYLSIYTIPSLFKIPVGFIQALWIILKEKPDVVLSFGGYVAVPIVIIAWLFSIPIIIHEQTLISGLANKICSLFADKIAVAFKENKSFPGEKMILTGNPIRKEIMAEKAITSAKNKLPVVLITGGNQGSHAINKAVENCLEKLSKIAYVIHQTGDSKYKDFERLEPKQNENYIVAKWIDMANSLRQADLIVSRAGINTLVEMAYLGKPGLVIPIPYVYKNEQNENALYFKKLGLVEILFQSELSGTRLFENIKSMLSDIENLKKRAKKARSIILPDASKKIALETILLAKKN